MAITKDQLAAYESNQQARIDLFNKSRQDILAIYSEISTTFRQDDATMLDLIDCREILRELKVYFAERSTEKMDMKAIGGWLYHLKSHAELAVEDAGEKVQFVLDCAEDWIEEYADFLETPSDKLYIYTVDYTKKPLAR